MSYNAIGNSMGDALGNALHDGLHEAVKKMTRVEKLQLLLMFKTFRPPRQNRPSPRAGNKRGRRNNNITPSSAKRPF